MAGPWEKYAKPEQAGPWTKYARQEPSEPSVPNADGTFGQVPEGMFYNPETGQYTSRELLRGNVEPSRINAAMGGAMQGLGFRAGDELIGGLGYLEGGPDMANLRQEQARAMLEANQQYYPWTSGIAEVGGAIMAPGVSQAARWVGQGGTVAAQAGRGLLTGAALGGAQGYLGGEGGADDRLKSGTSGAVLGGVVGLAVPVATAGIKKGVEKIAQSRATRQAIASAPKPDELRAAAGRLYQEADEVTNLPRGQFADRAQQMLAGAERKGLDADLTPGAARVADRITDAATDPNQNIGFRELDILRRKAAVPAGNVANRTEQSIASDMIEGIDDFIEAVDPSLSGKIKEARDMWGRLRRVEVVEGAIEKARNSASGFENGLRVEFRKLLNNPKVRRGFSKGEVEAIERVVRGTAAGNLMRQVGRVGIGLSGQSNGLGAAIGGIAGTAAGGPVGGAAALATGTGAKALAERTTRKAAENALGVVGARNALMEMTAPQLPGQVTNALNLLGYGSLPQGVNALRSLLNQ